MVEKGDHVLDTLRWLSHGPLPFVTKHNGYDINGFHFVTRDRESNRVTQNSGVGVDDSEICDMTYLGAIDKI